MGLKEHRATPQLNPLLQSLIRSVLSPTAAAASSEFEEEGPFSERWLLNEEEADETDGSVGDLNSWVFNTEAHPLPILRKDAKLP
jgi:hypothetical protein